MDLTHINGASAALTSAQNAATSSGTATGTGSGSSSSSSASNSINGLANENTFLQLLVAQIQNQDPLNPTDSTTFLTQLAQFSQLEQLIDINSAITNLPGAIAADTSAGATGTGSSTANISHTAQTANS